MFFKKVSAVLLGIIVVTLRLLIGNQLLSIIYYKIIGGGFIGYRTTASDTLYFFQVLLGIFLMLILVIGIFIFVAFVFRFFYQGAQEGKLFKRFSLIFSIIMYTIPVSLLLYLLAFSASITSFSISIIIISLILASIALYLYKSLK
ncbi:MAG: hypothetical protein ACOC2J_05225 [bacterium]